MAEKPRPSRPGSGPEPIADILARVLRETGLDRRRQSDLVDAWVDVAGPAVAARTRIGTFRKGVLVIEVDSSALKQELSLFQREELLAALRERMKGTFVEDLRFRLI